MFFTLTCISVTTAQIEHVTAELPIDRIKAMVLESIHKQMCNDSLQLNPQIRSNVVVLGLLLPQIAPFPSELATAVVRHLSFGSSDLINTLDEHQYRNDAEPPSCDDSSIFISGQEDMSSHLGELSMFDFPRRVEQTETESLKSLCVEVLQYSLLLIIVYLCFR